MKPAGYEYTIKMESMFRDKFSELKSYYCREDFEQAVRDVQCAPKDARAFRMHDLKRLCGARGLDAEELLGNEALLEEVPTRRQLQENLLQAFYEMYQNAPKTTDYMERIVHSLAPEYAADTVRTAILKKFLAGAGTDFKRFRTANFLAWGKKRLTKTEAEQFPALSASEQQRLILSKIDDSVFEQKTAALSGCDILRLIAGRIVRYREDETLSFDHLAISPETERQLKGFLERYGLKGEDSPAEEQIAEIMRGLETGTLSGEEMEQQISGLADSLETDFRNQLKQIPRVSKTGAAGNAAELYKQAKKDALKAVKAALKKEEPDYELLELCSDLAAGNFRVNGKTKVYLYYFALMFGMYMPGDTSAYERERSRFLYLWKHPEAVDAGLLGEKQKEGQRQLRNLTGESSLEELAGRLGSLGRDALYQLRDVLYVIVNCRALTGAGEDPETESCRAVLDRVQAFLEIRDVEKSLFQDFYHDNLLRFLESGYADPKMASSFEREPTGEGINYKSFVEAVYLYFICHQELDMTPGEKIDAAEAVIQKCVKLAKKAGNRQKTAARERTQVYRNCYMNALLHKEIDEIPEYIVENYVVISPENAGAARIMVAAEENTAFDLIGEIMEELDAVYPEVELFDVRKNQELSREIREELALQSASGFAWKLRTLLEDKFADDEDFQKVVRVADERLHVNSGRYNRSERRRLITMLHVLAVYSDEKEPLTAYRLQLRMKECGIAPVGMQTAGTLSVLKEIGYDIRRQGESCFLGERIYPDAALNELLDRVSGRYLVLSEQTELLMAQLLVGRLRYDRRVTRSELIAIHFNYYIALLNETEGLDTFPDVFEDYDATISPILEEARYQPLSEKNIFDMYVVTELYFYLMENNSYVS